MRVAIVCVLVLLLSLSPVAVAQEAAGTVTPAVSEDETAAPEAENEMAADDPVPVVAPAEVVAGYAGIVNRLVDLIIAVVAAGGGYAMVRAWRSPDQAQQMVNFGLAILEFGAKLTPSTADDAAVKRLRDEWNKQVAEAVKTAIARQVEAEREKMRTLTAQRAAEWKAAPLSASDQSVPPIPPERPAHG